MGQFRAYLGSSAFSGMAFAMQQLLLSWFLIGVLELPATQVGVIQAVIGVPGIFIMLIAGASADRTDPRRLLLTIYMVGSIFPIFLAVIGANVGISVWSVLLWGLGMSVVQAYSMPAQQAILNRTSGYQVQQGVTWTTALGFVVQVIGLSLAGQIDRVGIPVVLLGQAAVLLFAAISFRWIRPQTNTSIAVHQGRLVGILEGLRATYANKVIFHTLLINFLSTIFNAGSFMTVFPFIVKRVYEGNAAALAGLMAVFFVGAACSNAILLKFQPLVYPGRIFLLTQASRIAVLLLLYIQGDWWLLTTAVVLWGLNMGITSNLARTIVQETASEQFRGRIMSVFSISLMGSAPIGALILGWLIETVGTLNALWPAIVLSAALFVFGARYTGIWHYRSPQTYDVT